MEKVTKAVVAGKISDYLQHRISLAELVDWSEDAMSGDVDFEDGDIDLIADTVCRLGLADVREFGLTWEECEEILSRLGYTPRIEIIAA